MSQTGQLASTETGGDNKRTGLRLLLWLVLLAVLTYAYWDTFIWLWDRWFPSWKYSHWPVYDRLVEGESYYTHGPLVPLVSLLIAFLLVRKTQIPIRPAPILGWTVMGVSILVYLASVLAQVHFTAGFSMLGIVVAMVLILWGRGALRRLWFPIAFLVFMVPLPEVTIYEIAFRMKMFAARVGVSMADMLGVVVARNGNIVKIGAGSFEDFQVKEMRVANVCNGLRTMISLLAFGALYAYICRLRGGWRVFLFLLTIPVALLANSLRILSLIIVADVTNVEFATGWYHDTSGVLIFVVAFFLMFGLERAILTGRKAIGRPAKIYPLFHDVRKEDESDPQWSRMVAQIRRPRGVTMLVVLLVLMVGAGSWLDREFPATWDSNVAKRAVPLTLVIDGEEHFGIPMGELDEATRATLMTDDFMIRNYTGPVLGDVNFTVIFSKDNRKGTHPPDVCLAGSGEGILAKRDVVVSGVPGRGDVPCRELIVQQGNYRSYFLYTYKCGSQYTSSFWTQQITILLNGLTRKNASGALIRVSTLIRESQIEDARSRCKKLLRAAIPHLDDHMP